MTVVQCYFCKELVITDICDKVEVSRVPPFEGKCPEKKMVWRCFDCKNRRRPRDE